MRTPLETADKALANILAGEEFADVIGMLSKKERALLDSLAGEIRAGKNDQGALRKLWLYDYIREPPSIETFLNDPYWLGEVALPTEDNIGLWPTWREILINDWDLDSRIHNCVITGALGIGKTWLSVIIILYRLTVCSLLRNPTNFVGLSKGSRIIYVLMSVTQAQVQDTSFGDAMSAMSRSPYFKEVLGFKPDSKYSGNVIDLGPTLQLNAGSKSQHILGRNTLGIAVDEGNYRLEANPDVTAYKLYNEVRSRIKNRFQRLSGFMPAVSIIASSAKDESSFTESVIAEIAKADSRKTEMVYNKAVYKMKDADTWLALGADFKHTNQHAIKFEDRWFRVFHGLKTMPPGILSGWFDRDGVPIGDGPWPEQPQGSKVELVPANYRPEYERDPNRALQNFSGVSSGGSHRLFASMVDFEWCIDAASKLQVNNPCTTNIINLSEEDTLEVWDFLRHKEFLARVDGIIKPRRHPGAKRYVHMDLATRTKAGISICHAAGYRDVAGVIRRDGRVFDETRLIVEYDFVLTITSGRVKPVSFEKIQKFILWLRDMCGFSFGMVTADTFQSFMQLQMLETKGFKTGSLSVDKNKAPYYALRQGIEDHRTIFFRQDESYTEAEKLIDGPKMVDHPDEGSKDTMDGMAGCYWNCVSDLSALDYVASANPALFPSDQAPIERPDGVEIQVTPTHRVPRKFVT